MEITAQKLYCRKLVQKSWSKILLLESNDVFPLNGDVKVNDPAAVGCNVGNSPLSFKSLREFFPPLTIKHFPGTVVLNQLVNILRSLR
jgi:hypothetical protein